MIDTTLSLRDGKGDAAEWVPERIGMDLELVVAHVVRQVEALGLEREDGFLEILRANMGAQARDAAISGDFFHIVEANAPIEVGEDLVRVGGKGPGDDYDQWRDRRERTARQLIDKGMDALKRFDFNDFWDGKLWKRLTFNQSSSLLMEDGVALLKVVLGDAPESEQERLIAMALAERFDEDIVKAEIVDEKRRRVVSPDDALPIRAEDREELKNILNNFLVVAEGHGTKLYADTAPLSFSWAEKLMEAVERGDGELLTDLRELNPIFKSAALEGEDMSRQAYEAMAAILAKHFPSIVIGGLTPATEIIPRPYQESH